MSLEGLGEADGSSHVYNTAPVILKDPKAREPLRVGISEMQLFGEWRVGSVLYWFVGGAGR